MPSFYLVSGIMYVGNGTVLRVNIGDPEWPEPGPAPDPTQ